MQSDAAAEQEPSPDCNLEDTPAEEVSEAEVSEAVEVKHPVSRADKDRHPMPWGLLINDVFRLNVRETYERLNQELTLGDGATEYGSVIRAVDQSARNLFDAARLCRRAKLEDEKFTAELDKELEVLRTAAQRALEIEKAEGKRSKAPTIQDIKDRMLASWPDAVSSMEERKAEMHGAFRAIEALEGAWRDRCQALRTLALQFRSAGA